MKSNAVQEIERAIGELKPNEFEELCAWFDEHEHPFDARIRADLEAGRLDNFIEKALTEDRSGLVKKL